ncbi:MAG: DUF92 domain-containing protein [Ferruginibacter sp.]
MTNANWIFLLILIIAMFFSFKKDKLTRYGAITGGVIGCFIYLGAGFTGITMIGLFFLLGTIATAWKMDTKEKLGVAEKNKGRRTSNQVIANGAVAGITGLLSYFFPGQRELFQLMMAAALASATADTLSSELGTVYGKGFFNMLSFQQDKRGENGVVSVEGILFGIVGTVLIAAVYAIGAGWNKQFYLILVAGNLGNIADSILGATLERKKYLKNDGVNFISTLIAALTSLVLAIFF